MAFSMEKWAMLVEAREEIFWYQPTPEVLQKMMDQFREKEQEVLAFSREHPEYIRENSAQLKENYRRVSGRERSLPWICVSQILEGMYKPLETLAIDAYEQNVPSVFVYAFDIANGIMDVIVSVYKAEDHLRGDTDRLTVKAVEHASEWYQRRFNQLPSMDAQADLYLVWQKEYEYYAKLLMQDPTGNLLIDELVLQFQDERYRRKPSRYITSYQIPELFVAGAELAQKAYKLLYPLLI